MEHLNYNHLYYFWMIAKEGGVTAACKKLRLTQPTLSSQLKQFEDFLGKSLFERKSRQLILNDAGKTVFDYADSIFKMGEQLTNAIQDSSVKDSILFQVGILATLPKKNAHGYVKNPIRQGKVTITLVIGNMNELEDKLVNHHIDMILTDQKASSEMKGVFSHHLEKVPVIFVASPEHKNLRRKFPQSLAGQNIFLPTHQSDIRSELDLFFKKNGIEPKIKGEIQDDELLRVIASSGDGIVAIARSAVSDLIKTKELCVIGDTLDVWKNFYLITAERKSTHPVVLEILKQYEE